MKTKELIKRLQDADPSGEIECCVGNQDIYFISQEPSYYDGALQVLIHDEKLRDKCWSIVGAKIIRTSQPKIQIHILSIQDVLFDTEDNKDFPVEVIGDSIDGYYTNLIKTWKEKSQGV